MSSSPVLDWITFVKFIKLILMKNLLESSLRKTKNKDKNKKKKETIQKFTRSNIFVQYKGRWTF